MEPQSGETRTNGSRFGAIEKSVDPEPPRLGVGNRISSEREPAIVAAAAQFGEAATKQKRATPAAEAEKTPRESTKDVSSEDSAGDHKGGKKDHGETSNEAEPKGPPLYKRPLPMAILIGVVIGLIVFGILFWLHARHFEGTDDAFIEAHVTPISPHVAAIVQTVMVDDNNFVRQGQTLVQLDPSDFQAALKQAKANEASMRGKVSQAQSMLEVNKAGVLDANAELAVAQVNFENADRDYQRYLALDERARSKQQMDNATAAERSTQSQVIQAKAKVAQAEAQVASAQSQIETARADVDRAAADVQSAELNLSYCTIASPQDGYITRKNVEPGSYVQVGQVLCSTVPTNVWVIANFKETQLDLMRPNQPVDIHVDAYPDKTFHGQVDSIEAGTGSRFSLLPPENATGNYVKVVQRVPVKIVFDPGETEDRQHVLGVGMSVEPEVKVR